MAADFWKPMRSLTFPDVEVLKTSGDRESTVIDYKQFNQNGSVDPEKLADDFAAFANSGGGRLVIGVKEKKDESIDGFAGIPKAKVRGVTSTLRNMSHRVPPP
jgi:predicted HTH transcriptional regulator